MPKHKFPCDTEGACVSKNFDETVHLQHQKSDEWSQGIRGERLHGTTHDCNSAPRQAHASVVLLLEKNV